MRFFVMAALSCAAILPSASARADDFPAGLDVRDYTGWSQSLYINATETPVQVVVVPEVGGRIAHFSLNGENILFENSATEGKTMGPLRENLWLGGYQCGLGRGWRPLPAYLDLLQGPVQFKLGDFAVHVTGAPDTNAGVAVNKDFVLAPDTGDLGIMQRLRNVSSNAVSYFIRDRTLCKGGGFVFFPLNPKSRFKAGWSLLRPMGNEEYSGGRNYYDGNNPTALQVHILDGVLVAQGMGDVAQIGADSAAGWVAYARGKTLFVKYFPWTPGGNYTDFGNTVEVYIDQRAVELSPLSPETRLAPGAEYNFPEKWTLIELSHEVRNWNEARRLVRKIPASPFHS